VCDVVDEERWVTSFDRFIPPAGWMGTRSGQRRQTTTSQTRGGAASGSPCCWMYWKKSDSVASPSSLFPPDLPPG